MNTHDTLKEEAARWVWTHLMGEPAPENSIRFLVAEMDQPKPSPMATLAIAYVESAKTHLDMVTELEANLEAVTQERDTFKAAFSNSVLHRLQEELGALRLAARIYRAAVAPVVARRSNSGRATALLAPIAEAEERLASLLGDT